MNTNLELSHPTLCLQWHPTLNEELKPTDVTSGSAKKVWWTCSEGADHIWQATISNRANGTSCPFCANRKVSVTNRLDLIMPNIALEWNNVKNGELRPDQFTVGSAKKVWWNCKKSSIHQYEMQIAKRTSGQNCPYCSGRKICSDNNLAVLRPSIAEEWHPTKNGALTPLDCTEKSGKKVWWMCKADKSHEWNAKILHRSNGRGCPYCSSNLVTKENNLAAKDQKLAREWHQIKNGDLTPSDVGQFSNRKVWWKCPEQDDHEWEGSVAGRHGNGCPYCSNLRLCKTNSLAFIAPQLVSEWHPEKNGRLKPRDVIAGGKKKHWWICSKSDDHAYQASIYSRLRGSGCPRCTHQTSSHEIRILTELKYMFRDVLSRYKQKGMEIDVYLPEIRVGVEYDGAYFHKERYEKDREKGKRLDSEGITLIRVRDKPLEKISPLDICANKSDSLCKADLDLLVKTIANIADFSEEKISQYLSKNDFVNEDLYRIYLSYFPSPFPENALPATHPKLIPQWDYEANAPLVPENFTKGSHKKVHWLCEIDEEHRWQVSILSRTGKGGTGCPFCSGKRLSSNNSLKTTHPDLVLEWHPIRNGDLKPDQVSRGSSKWVWWRCSTNNAHEWKTRVRTRGVGGNGCPECNRLRGDRKPQQ